MDTGTSESDEGTDLPSQTLSIVPNEEVSTLEAGTIYLLMKENIPISRTSRVQWLLSRLNTTITLPYECNHKWTNDDNEFKVLSVIPAETFHFNTTVNNAYKYLITTNTKLVFIAHCYRIVYCFDMSPSQSSADIQHGEILFDEVLTWFRISLEEICNPFTVPGSQIAVQPKIYLTVIAHTPFFMTPAQQVLVKGIQISPANLDEIFCTVERQVKILEERIADVTAMTHDQIDAQRAENEKLIGSLFEEEQTNWDLAPNIPMVSPDANFVNMLRYSMLALSLLPENSLSNILVITDGVVTLPDVNIMESLLMQLHYDGIAVSFIKVGSPFHPHVCAGYVPYSDILRFFSHSTMGTYLETIPESKPKNAMPMNFFQKAYLTWTFHSSIESDNNMLTFTTHWKTSNEYFHGQKAPILLRKKQAEDKINTSLSLLLSRRIREGFMVEKIYLENSVLHIKLSLPWKHFIYLQYTIKTQWPSKQALIHYEVHVAAPYEFLHDITCLMKKELKSSFRQAVIERFWYALTHLSSGDTALLQHLNTFRNSSTWYTLPESIKNRMSVFIIMNNTQIDSGKPQFVANDISSSKFGSAWQSISQLDNSQWNKWFHTHKISLIIRHDDPLPRNLHLANSSGRFQIVQCRQSASILNLKLSEWSSFILIENHSYVKFLYKDSERPKWFCIIRVASKFPCVVINLGFNNGTPGYVRQQVCNELKEELSRLCFSSLKYKDNNACVLLHKPLEKILIRYERMPSDFNTVVFPDGTQPPNPHQHLSPPPVVGALFTTLSRYLYHRRWIWNATYLNNPKLGFSAIAQILITLTKMRLKEGFSFAHSASGIVNMVLEVEMGPFDLPGEPDNTLNCLIQYVLFPPHSTSRSEFRDQTSESDDENEIEQECDIDLQMITEVWIEPQHGQVVNSPTSRYYMDSEPYYKVADKIGYVDHKCISSLLTLEHLSLMCQVKSMKTEENTQSDLFSIMKPSTNNRIPKRKTSNARRNSKINVNSINSSPLRLDFGYFGKEFGSSRSTETSFQAESTALMDDRIHLIPFNFNLNNILSICQQTELLFSMFIEEEIRQGKNQCDFDRPNKLLMEAFHNHLQLLHDRELTIGPEDSQYFLELLYEKHKNNRVTHDCPISLCNYTSDISQDDFQSRNRICPQWRCFIKGISITHVILTFVPASITDLKMLINPETNDHNADQETSRTESVDLHTNNNIILPVYVYDCPLAMLINFYINPGKKLRDDSLKDIYENHTFKTMVQFEQEFLQLKLDNNYYLRPDTKNGDTNANDNKSSMKQHCKTLVVVHSKCFVVSLFMSLRYKIPVHRLDVQSAVSQCEKAVDEIDVTEYLRVICGHLKFHKGTEISTNVLFEKSVCDELKPLHNLIKEKFMKITKLAFQPISTNPQFYFCLPLVTPDKMTTKDEDSDDEMSSVPSEAVFKSDQDSILSLDESDMPCFSNTTALATNYFIEDDDEVAALFLHLTCSIHVQDAVIRMPITDLPTCLGEILKSINYTASSIDLNNFRITLDIICLTLPADIHSVINASVTKGLRTTSFCSVSSCQPSSINSETSLISEDQECVEATYSLNHLPEFQQRAVKMLNEEIKLLLRDEMVTSLLDLEPVTTETLHMVINHVEASVSKISCRKDIIQLNFVYGISHSHDKFLHEFKKLSICMRNNAKYKLCEENNLYYLAKDVCVIPEEEIFHSRLMTLITCENESTDSDINNVFLEDANEENENHVRQVGCDARNYEQLYGRHSSCPQELRHTLSSEDGLVFSDGDEDFEWLTQLDKKRLVLPNFWLILRVDQEAVTVYFHCRFLELRTSKVGAFVNVQKSVILAVKELCKRVNQSLLLQYLHDTRMCDRLLEPEDNKKEVWHSDNTTPTITRNTSFVRLRSVDDCLLDSTEFHQAAYLEASLKFTPGFFRCEVVWQTHFSLHPRLKTGPGKSGLSRGIQALRTVLNKFSVSNRSNMFVYQDTSSNVFYLRLHENVQNGSRLMPSRLKNENNIGLVSRSPSIASLPLGHQKSILAHSEHSIASVSDIRPRVRSIGEKERTDVIEDTIILKVHGITDAGPDVKCDLVQVLQNRLDDAVLEVLSMMLARNAMCPLTPEDVQFLQKPFRPPEHTIKLSVPDHALQYLDSFIQYLRQNLLQFLNVPKYTDPNSHNHFKDYTEPDQNTKLISEDHIFLYNQSQNPSSGSRGIACVALAIINNKTQTNPTSSQHDYYTNLFENTKYDDIVATQIIDTENDVLPKTYLEFRIWKQGRVNLDALNSKLKSAVSQAVWDLVTEYHLLRAPLCSEDDINPSTTPHDIYTLSLCSGLNVTSSDAQFQKLYNNKNLIISKVKKGSSYVMKPGRKIVFDETVSNVDASLASVNASVYSVENILKSPSNSLSQSVARGNIEASMKHLEIKLNFLFDKYEKGETGLLHNIYSNILVKWFEFAIDLGVPAIKKCYISLANRHSVGICARELQLVVNLLAPDTSLKTFDLQNYQTSPANDSEEEIYLPCNMTQMSNKCMLIGRNMEQWKISTLCDIVSDYPSSSETSLLKHYQKFLPQFSSENTLVPRQRLFLAIVLSSEITLYTYNWSKERVDKLNVQSNNLGMWLGARTSVLSSIVAQKRGLFHNQLLSRKSAQTTNNPYLTHVGESSDHLYRFLSTSSSINKEWSTRKSNQAEMHGTTVDAFRDARPSLAYANKKNDIVVSYSQEMHEIRQRYKVQLDEKKKMHTIWQSRSVSENLLQSHMLKKHARTIHYCHTPLLFLSRWRLMSAATRDHSLSTEMLDENNVHIHDCNEYFTLSTVNESWHDELCSNFIREYKQYLQTLGFVPLETNGKRDQVILNNKEAASNFVCYVQKPMLGGIMIFTVELKEPFFAVKVHAIECCRLQQKVSSNSINQFTLSFLDECDRIKSLMHLHSFTYDFHLRCIHSYIANSSGVKFCTDYHFTRFLDDFNKYYPKTPNFARNVVCSEIITIKDLLTEGLQLYTYLLSNNKQYGMNILSMVKEDAASASDNEYVLIQVSNTPQIRYKDSQDRQQTDDFNVTLIISNFGTTSQPHENVLRLKFYIILTSRREIFPKCDIEKTLGKFRTVSCTGCSSLQEIKNEYIECVSTNSEEVCNTLNITRRSSDLDTDMSKSEELEFPAFTSVPSDMSIYLNNKSDESEHKERSKSQSNGHSHSYVKIREESVNYLGYYSSHEQLMQQLMTDQAEVARQQIRNMVAQGMVHCRTHLLWNKLVSHPDSNYLNYNEFMELRGLAKLENLIDFQPDLKILLDQPFTWYQGLTKLLIIKYNDQHRMYISPDGNIQHLVVLHPRYMGTFMMVSMDMHTSRGDLYAASQEPSQCDSSEICNSDRKELINGFINCVAAHVWLGMLQS